MSQWNELAKKAAEQKEKVILDAAWELRAKLHEIMSDNDLPEETEAEVRKAYFALFPEGDADEIIRKAMRCLDDDLFD